MPKGKLHSTRPQKTTRRKESNQLERKQQDQVKMPLNNKVKMEIKIETLNLCLGLQNKKNVKNYFSKNPKNYHNLKLIIELV